MKFEIEITANSLSACFDITIEQAEDYLKQNKEELQDEIEDMTYDLILKPRFQR